MSRNLEYVLEQVNRWLAFAEAKNAMIVLINITLIIAEFNLIYDQILQLFVLNIFAVSAFLLGISSITALYSFLPKTGQGAKKAKDDKDHSVANLIHFGDISVINNANEYMRLYFARYSHDIDTASNFEIDLSGEILTNSQITMEKLRLFKLATWLTITAVFLPLADIGLAFLQKVV